MELTTPILAALLAGGAAAPAAPPAARPVATALDACASSSALDRAEFLLRFEPNASGAPQGTAEFLFEPTGCYVHDRDGDGDPIDPPVAIRTYRSARMNLGLQVETVSGGEASRFSIVQYTDPSGVSLLNSGYFGSREFALSELEGKGATIEGFSMAVYEPRYEKWEGNGTLALLPPADASVEAVDRANGTHDVFKIYRSEEKGRTTYLISNGRELMPVVVAGDAPIDAGAGVSLQPKPEELLQRYQDVARGLSGTGTAASANAQLRLTLKEGRPSPLEAALLIFMIDEWFYYG